VYRDDETGSLSSAREVTLRKLRALHYARHMQSFTQSLPMMKNDSVPGPRLFLISIVVSLLVSCQALAPQDERAPLQTQGANFQAEVAQLQTSSASDLANAQATFEFARTDIAVDNAVNQQLLATLSIRITPTPRLTTDNAVVLTTPGAGSGVDTMGSEGIPARDTGSAFLVTGMATSVRESDGCVETTTSSFSIDAPRVYATFVANNLQAGTPLRVDWVQNGEVLYFSDWTPDQNYPQICVWFYITNADVPFTPGSWSARVVANDQLVQEIPFTFEGAVDNVGNSTEEISGG
jgi:hypothetical protein